MPNGRRILVVDDDRAMAETIAEGLVDRGHDAFALSSSRDAATQLEHDAIDALVTDLRMPQVDGLGLLAVSKRADPTRPVIVMTAFSAVESAIESIRQGAYHYLTKPFKVDELALFLANALGESSLRREASALRRALEDARRSSVEGIAFTGEVIPMRELERRYATWALGQLGGRRVETAERLGVDERTLERWLDDGES
jgi:two-component system response regulator HydG